MGCRQVFWTLGSERKQSSDTSCLTRGGKSYGGESPESFLRASWESPESFLRDSWAASLLKVSWEFPESFPRLSWELLESLLKVFSKESLFRVSRWCHIVLWVLTQCNALNIRCLPDWSACSLVVFSSCSAAQWLLTEIQAQGKAIVVNSPVFVKL